MKLLTEEQREKLQRKVELWMILHHDDVDDAFKSTCSELKCPHLNICFADDNDEFKIIRKPSEEFLLIFFFPAINPHLCFGWLWSEEMEKQ